MMISKQFDMPQQQAFPLKKEDDATPLLSAEEETLLAAAFKEQCNVDVPSGAAMEDVEKSLKKVPAPAAPEEIAAALMAQAKTVLDVYDCLVTSPAPGNFCVSYQLMVQTVKHMCRNLKQPYLLGAEEYELPAVLSEICLKGLKGEINGFTESGLAMKLCRKLVNSPPRVHELVTKGVMQALADVLLQCRSTSVRMNVLKTVKALAGQEEALEAMEKQGLVIANKGEEVIPEEKRKEVKSSKPKEKDQKEHEKEREKSKTKDKDSKKSKDKKRHKHDKDKS